MKKWFNLAAAMSLLAAPAAGASQAQSRTAPTEESPAPSREIVVTGERPKPPEQSCKRSVATGSIMPVTTCRTAAEWEAITRKSVADFERMKAEQQSRQHLKQTLEMDKR